MTTPSPPSLRFINTIFGSLAFPFPRSEPRMAEIMAKQRIGIFRPEMERTVGLDQQGSVLATEVSTVAIPKFTRKLATYLAWLFDR